MNYYRNIPLRWPYAMPHFHNVENSQNYFISCRASTIKLNEATALLTYFL